MIRRSYKISFGKMLSIQLNGALSAVYKSESLAFFGRGFTKSFWRKFLSKNFSARTSYTSYTEIDFHFPRLQSIKLSAFFQSMSGSLVYITLNNFLMIIIILIKN